jgi:hypothetical protein
MNIHQPALAGTAEPRLIGKLVQCSGGGAIGRVVRRSEQFRDQYLVRVIRENPDDLVIYLHTGNLDLLTPSPVNPDFLNRQQALVDAFNKKGSYARTKHGIVYILDGGESGYWVTYTQHDKEFFCHPEEMTLWIPLAGEKVANRDNDDSPTGIVVEVGDGTSTVKWECFTTAQTCNNADLEPAWAR